MVFEVDFLAAGTIIALLPNLNSTIALFDIGLKESTVFCYFIAYLLSLLIQPHHNGGCFT